MRQDRHYIPNGLLDAHPEAAAEIFENDGERWSPNVWQTALGVAVYFVGSVAIFGAMYIAEKNMDQIGSALWHATSLFR
jgi:hypothetical protein